MEPQEAVSAEETRVSCDGGGGSMGHPRVFLEIGAPGEAVCPYCSRRFVLTEKPREAAS